jgi:hypothetical protein
MSNNTPHPITITLRKILAAHPCYDPREKGLLPSNHDLDAPITFREIAKAAKPLDVVWCFANLPGHDSLKRHFAVECVERDQSLMKDWQDAIAGARRYADGQATDKKLRAAEAAAQSAAWAALSAAHDAKRAWQARRIIELTDAGRWTR